MQARSNLKKNDILDVAAILFAERGYQGTNMKMLANASQASTSTIYSYFSDKHDLLSQAIERRMDRLEARLIEQNASEPDPVQSLLAGVSLLNSTISSDPLLARMLNANTHN